MKNLYKKELNKFLSNPNNESLCNIGSLLSDCGVDGCTLILSEDEANRLGKILLKLSVKLHPNTKNMFALQIACLHHSNDYNFVLEMEEQAKRSNNYKLLNNVAYAAFFSENYDHARLLQADVIKQYEESGNNDCDIVYFNYLVYSYYSGRNIKTNKKHYELAIKALLDDDVFDYAQAVLLAVLCDDKIFVINNYEKSQSKFYYEKQEKKIVKNYLSNRIIPKFNSVSKLIIPIETYDDYK